MKKLLVGTAVVALGFGLSAPAHAAKDGVKLSLGGSFAGYMSWVDQDETTGTEVQAVDIQRETEIHFTGETTLDNGLTVGFHLEAEADGFSNTANASGSSSSAAGDSFDIEESYAYFSGAWGRVNFGAEDGAAFLLQVAAPGADSNIDGVRQQVQPVNIAATDLGAALAGLATPAAVNTRFDYDNAPSHSSNKLTYMTPVFNGFQFGVSYDPQVNEAASNFAQGNNLDDRLDVYGDAWEAGARYEGQLGDVGVAFGGGYSNVQLEDSNAASAVDDRVRWDVGLDLNWGAFGLGAAYYEDDHGFDNLDSDETVWVVGVDYTTGPFKLGASYYNSSQELDGAAGTIGNGDLDVDRWMGGVTYAYGPGMTFRGSVGFIDAEVDDLGAGLENNPDATFVMLGTQINF